MRLKAKFKGMSDLDSTRVAVVGASGYSGAELIRILLGHELAELVCVTSRVESGRKLSEVFPRFRGVEVADKLEFIEPDMGLIIGSGAEVVFLALPHGVAAEYAGPLVDSGIKVIDLSADFGFQTLRSMQTFMKLIILIRIDSLMPFTDCPKLGLMRLLNQS